METAFYALLGLNLVYFAFAAWEAYRRTKMLGEAMQLLASRSFGEYASGKAKLNGTAKEAPGFDPGF